MAGMKKPNDHAEQTTVERLNKKKNEIQRLLHVFLSLNVYNYNLQNAEVETPLLSSLVLTFIFVYFQVYSTCMCPLTPCSLLEVSWWPLVSLERLGSGIP